MVFPGLTNSTTLTFLESDGPWFQIFFMTTFNLFDTIGRYIGGQPNFFISQKVPIPVKDTAIEVDHSRPGSNRVYFARLSIHQHEVVVHFDSCFNMGGTEIILVDFCRLQAQVSFQLLLKIFVNFGLLVINIAFYFLAFIFRIGYKFKGRLSNHFKNKRCKFFEYDWMSES